MIGLLIALLLLCRCASADDKPALPYFTITVVDDETGRGVPLVELKTTNDIQYVTDSNGIVAFYEPGLMGRDVFFHVRSHGYSYPKDNFGYAGRTLRAVEGGSAEIRVKRENIAQRLYRITGQGIYADSLLAGHTVPTKEPSINGLVMGQDSVLSTIYKGKVYWFWGDTGKPSYPLGNFHTSGATSLLPGKGGLDPEAGIDLTYFVDEAGFSKKMMPFDAPGPVWLGGLITLTDDKSDRLFAMYSNVNNHMQAQEIGIAEFDDEKGIFVKAKQFDLDTPIKPGGHPFRAKDRGVEYIYFSPITRVRADEYALLDPTKYEAYTCLKQGSRKDDPQIDQAADGRPVYSWKRNTPALFPQDEAPLIKDGKLKAGNPLFQVRDSVTGKPVLYHGASIAWNEYRRRWTMILQEAFGSSFLGEIWYLEADRPEGPWVYARKVVTHDNYSFYNPRHHPMFDKDGGRVIFFEGTYTHTFSSSPFPTPRYDYNQIMYKLDLADPRLALPAAVYSRSGVSDFGFSADEGDIAFFALDRPGVDTVAVLQSDGTLRVGDRNASQVTSAHLFHALPADTQDPPPTTTPLYEFIRDSDGRRAYTTDAAWTREGYRRSERPVCIVWKRPGG